MMKLTARTIYVALIALHPRGFRDAFAGDMLCLYDDAVDMYGAHWLLRDAALSLLRQRLLRSEEEVESAAAQEQFGLLAGIYPERRAPHLTAAKLTGGLVLTLLSFFIFPPRGLVQHHPERTVKPVHVGVRYGSFENR